MSRPRSIFFGRHRARLVSVEDDRFTIANTSPARAPSAGETQETVYLVEPGNVFLAALRKHVGEEVTVDIEIEVEP